MSLLFFYFYIFVSMCIAEVVINKTREIKVSRMNDVEYFENLIDERMREFKLKRISFILLLLLFLSMEFSAMMVLSGEILSIWFPVVRLTLPGFPICALLVTPFVALSFPLYKKTYRKIVEQLIKEFDFGFYDYD